MMMEAVQVCGELEVDLAAMVSLDTKKTACNLVGMLRRGVVWLSRLYNGRSGRARKSKIHQIFTV